MQYGFESILPPLIAIVLAILTRRVVLPLATGIFVGAVLLSIGKPDSRWFDSFVLFVSSLVESVRDLDHLKTLAFTLLLGAMVGVMEIGGGIRSLIFHLSKRIRSRSGAKVMISLSGLIIFFDDYANTLLIGGTMRSTADRYKISRAKLAYLVDSTAAPVAGLSVISTWTAIEISYIAEGLKAAGIDDSSAAFSLFLESIPYRFYPVLAIVMVFYVSVSGRDFPAMRKVEKDAIASEQHVSTEASGSDPGSDLPSRLWLAAIVPITCCVAAIVSVLVFTGLRTAEVAPHMSTFRTAIEIIGSGDSYLALIIGGGVGLMMAVWMHRLLSACSKFDMIEGIVRGAWQMMPAMLILWLAWALGAMTQSDALDTGGYLSGILSDRLAAEWLPATVFLLAGFVAFSTGTSWGTMAILTPLAVTLSIQMDSVAGPHGAICLATSGAVLAGAILGDHCSPISDTTVLSSRASGCDHVEHVRTQMPYALVVGFVSVVAGCIPAAYGISPWICLVVGAMLLAILLQLFGQRPNECH